MNRYSEIPKNYRTSNMQNGLYHFLDWFKFRINSLVRIEDKGEYAILYGLKEIEKEAAEHYLRENFTLAFELTEITNQQIIADMLREENEIALKIKALERKRSSTPAGKEILRKRLEKLENQYEEARNRRMAEQEYQKECKND